MRIPLKLSFLTASLFLLIFGCFSVLNAEETSEQISNKVYTVSLSQNDDQTVLTFRKNISSDSVVFAAVSLPEKEILAKKVSVDQKKITLNLADRSFIVELPDDQKISDAEASFIQIYSSPKTPAEGICDRFPLPALTVPAGCLSENSADLISLGTGGLKPVDKHKGSYTFLAIANPVNNEGVVGGWATNNVGNGVLFSAFDENKNVTITPQMDYGNLKLSRTDVVPELFLFGYFEDARFGLEAFADVVVEKNNVHLKPAPSGYCTWYSNKHGGAGSEKTTAEFAEVANAKLVPFGMNLFQIDDKWQEGNSKNGPHKNFTTHRTTGPYPSGMKPTAETLNANGLTAGIWFMPFSGNYDDPWYADERQEWFVKSAIDYPLPGEKNTRRYSSINQKKGAPYETYWGGTCLDVTNPDVVKYIHDEVDQISNKWGYKYFKIDGLWTAGAIEQIYVNDEYHPEDIGKQIFHDPNITNMEAFRKGVKLVRSSGGDDVFILGCNVSQNMRTLGCSFGLLDAVRIGPDNGSSWSGICAGPWRGSNRYFFNARVWWNDPDPVYVRNSIPLEHAQVSTSWAALTGQLFLFSDWLPELSDERVDVLRRTMPNHQLKTVRPIDLFTSEMARIWLLTDQKEDVVRSVAGFFNWNEKEAAEFDPTPEELGLPTAADENKVGGKYIGYNFWKKELIPAFGPAVEGNEKLHLNVAGGDCAIVAIRAIEDHPILLSTSRHLTQGILEVVKEVWNADKQVLSIEIDAEKAALNQIDNFSYELRVFIPSEFISEAVQASLDGKNVVWTEAGDALYSVEWQKDFWKDSTKNPTLEFHFSDNGLDVLPQ